MDNTNKRGLPTDDGDVTEQLEIVTFESILSPTKKEDFIREYWGKRFFYQEGSPGRFRRLLGWDQLNLILETHQLQSFQLMLVQNGKPIDPLSYLHSRGRGAPPRIKSHDLLKHLAKGATLILNHVDEIDAVVQRLACNIEDELSAPTSINLYGAWRTEPGFNLHWDIQETLILQLSGRKSWKVYNPTRIHPFKDDVVNAEPPTGVPDWEGQLSDGDVLYMPRGWWHAAIPTNEPSLHLTVTIRPFTGHQFLRWLVDQLRTEAVVRMDVPNLANFQDRKNYAERLFQVIPQYCTHDFLERYLREVTFHTIPRPQFNLPDVGNSD